MGGRISSGTKPSFHKREVNGWTGLQPFLALSGGLPFLGRHFLLPLKHMMLSELIHVDHVQLTSMLSVI